LIIPANILFEASLSYLGVGVPPETPSWGRQLSDANQWFQSAWWMLVFPGVILLLTTLAFNLVGDGLRDALDPRAAAMSYRRVHRRKRQREARRNGEQIRGPGGAIAVEGST
jgi:peptide/nickel transport system permease protein